MIEIFDSVTRRQVCDTSPSYLRPSISSGGLRLCSSLPRFECPALDANRIKSNQKRDDWKRSRGKKRLIGGVSLSQTAV